MIDFFEIDSIEECTVAKVCNQDFPTRNTNTKVLEDLQRAYNDIEVHHNGFSRSFSHHRALV